jgi:hypothetical protein
VVQDSTSPPIMAARAAGRGGRLKLRWWRWWVWSSGPGSVERPRRGSNQSQQGIWHRWWKAIG